jgi:hypothetical protein
MRRATILVLSVLAIPMLIGCGGEKASTEAPVAPAKPLVALPSTDVAGEVVSKSQEFSEYMFTQAAYSLPMQGSQLRGAAREAAEDLEKAEWVVIDPGGNLVISGKSVGDKRFIPRDNGSLDIVPLARKEFASVDGVGHDDAGDVTVDFTWRWLPNEIAQSFERGAIATRYIGDRKARATIYPTRSGWNVLRIVEVEQPAPAVEATETSG